MRVQFGPFRPDMPDFEGQGADVIRNVIPVTGGYAPALSQERIGSSVTGEPIIGAVGVFDAAETAQQYAGSASNLFQQAVAGAVWNNVSRGAGYTTAPGERWRFTNFGLRLLATNFTNEIQTKDLRAVASFDDLPGAPPRARYIATIRDFVVLGFINDGQISPYRVRWSAISNSEGWPVPGADAAIQVQSDQQDLPGDFGHITGIVGGLAGADGVVFQERGLTRMSFDTTGRFFFLFDTIEGGRGTAAPSSIVQVAGIVFYLGEDGFYSFNGVQSRPIGAGKVDRTFFSDVQTDKLDGVTATADPLNKVVYWVYPSRFEGTKAIAYSWDVDEWSIVYGYDIVEMTRALTIGVNMDDDLDAEDALLDSDALSLDNPIWSGGSQIIGGFDPQGFFVSFTGPPLPAVVQTGEQALSMEQRTFLRELWPDVEGPAQIKMRTIHRNRLVDDVITGALSDQNEVGFCPQRVNDRYMRFEAQIDPDPSAAWQFAKTVEAVGTAAGRR